MYIHGKAKGALASLATFVLMAICLMFGAGTASAQETTGALRGTVTDVNGAVVSGANVTITNEATGASQTKQTTGDGIFEFSKLAPGSYTVTIEATGFKRALNKEVSVKLGIVNPLDVKLEPGAVSETVTVTAGTEEIVQRDQSQISHTVETRKIADLPSNAAGSGLDTLALLAPGVIPNNSGGVNTNGSGLSVNGNRARSNNFQIDGSDNNDLSVAGPALFVDAQDSLQEYQIITNNFSAQYGRNQGAIVNLVTKSGSNDFHGTLFEYHRDRKVLDTLDNFERAGGQTEPLPSLFNVFGGQVGGPMYLPKFGEGGKSYWKGTNKAFFHFDYQGIRNPASATLRSTSLAFVPSEFSRLLATFPGNGVFQTISQFSVFAIPGTTPRSDLTGAHTVFINPTLPAASRISNTQRPGDQGPFQIGGPFDVINLGGTLFQAANPERIVSEPFNENYWDFRFDIKPNNKDSITIRNLHQTQLFINTLASTNGFSGDLPATSKNFGGNWTHSLSPSLINEARATYQRIGVEFGGGCDAQTPGCVPAPLQIGSALANIGFAGITGFTKTSSALQTIGPATNLPQGRVGKVYQFADNLTWARGKHSIIVGGEYKHLNEVVPFLPNFNGAYAYSGSTAFTRIINNAPSGISLTAGDPTLAFTEDDQYYFFQDDFKIRPNFTLNLGVRYEYTGQPINKLHDVTVARESGSSPFYDPKLPLSIKTVPQIPADKNNFAPRFGFAWSPHFEKGFLHSLLGTDATVFRGGYSIAYDASFYNILLNVQNGAPFSAALALSNANALSSTTTSPLPLPGSPFGDIIRSNATTSGVLPLGKLDPRYLSQTTVAPDFHSPYSEQWSFGVQHQFGRNQVAEARYVGTRGLGLFQNINDNFFVGPMYNGFTLGGISFPSFKQFIPAGITPQVCTDNPATPFVNESTCNGRIKPQAGITMRANTANSWYNGMQLRYNGRLMKDSLSVGASYTWSKTLDDASEIFAFDIASANAQNPFSINRAERALSQIDRRSALSANFIWDMPWMKEQKGVVGHLLGGWQVNGVYLLVSGEPYTPGQFFNGSVYGLGNTYLTSGDRPFLGNPAADPRLVAISQTDAALIFGAPLANPTGFYSMNEINLNGNFVPVTASQVHYIVNLPGSAKIFNTPFGDSPRNSLFGPRLNQLNLGLFKHINIGERWKLELRAEAYNFLNHPNPGYGVNGAGYLPDFFVEDAGIPLSSFAQNSDIEKSRRVLQFGLRLSF